MNHENVSTIRIKRFDLSRMKNDAVTLIIGKRNTGKTVVLMDIMWHKRLQYPAGIAVSGSEAGNGNFRKYIPDTFVYSEYKPYILTKLVDRQRKVKDANETSITRSGRPLANPNTFCILDDVVYDSSVLKGKELKFIVFNGRHYNIGLYILVQYCLAMGPDLRSNVDYVFVSRENIVSNKKRLYEQFFGVFPSYDTFDQVFSQCTDDFHFIVLDNSINSTNPEDCIFLYKAEIREPFRLCHPSAWTFHKTNYDENHDRRNEGKGPDEITTRFGKKGARNGNGLKIQFV